MSAEYALRMEVLRAKREELTARRHTIEKKLVLREATAAEFSAVALQSQKQKWKRLRSAAVAAKTRNDEFIRSLHDTQRKANDAYLKQKNDLTASSAALEQEKRRYFQRIEAIYPAWQEKLQAMRLQQLKALEEKKQAVEKRRYLAKKTFEKEQSLDDLIRQTNHEIELSENLERNEAYERELLRKQSAIQANRLDHTIREHAIGARSYMVQQAQEQIREATKIDDEVADKLFETFSPRSALNALKQANSV
uniref:Uncharacterized protein n=1 Tax=Globisporangium ultimum (strain ATCC 200006 / CBS 805.95 / DAOM BR144) TaxID=431595 RepID=K3W7S7_GLOUD